MAEDIQPRRGVHSRGHGPGIDGVTDAECGLQVAVRNAGLCLLLHQVKDGRTSGLRARSSCGRHSDERFELSCDWEPFTQWRIDEVQEIGIWEAGVQVHQLCGINDGPTTNREERIWLVGFRK